MWRFLTNPGGLSCSFLTLILSLLWISEWGSVNIGWNESSWIIFSFYQRFLPQPTSFCQGQKCTMETVSAAPLRGMWTGLTGNIKEKLVGSSRNHHNINCQEGVEGGLRIRIRNQDEELKKDRESNEQNELTSNIRPEAWAHGTDWLASMWGLRDEWRKSKELTYLYA